MPRPKPHDASVEEDPLEGLVANRSAVRVKSREEPPPEPSMTDGRQVAPPTIWERPAYDESPTIFDGAEGREKLSKEELESFLAEMVAEDRASRPNPSPPPALVRRTPPARDGRTVAETAAIRPGEPAPPSDFFTAAPKRGGGAKSDGQIAKTKHLAAHEREEITAKQRVEAPVVPGVFKELEVPTGASARMPWELPVLGGLVVVVAVLGALILYGLLFR